MKNVHIVNPVSGKGRAMEYVKIKNNDDIVYKTNFRGDAERYIKSLLQTEPYIHIFVYGGDGTLSEVVNGIMSAGAAETAVLTSVAAGSGNDYIRYINSLTEEEFPRDQPNKIDIIKFNSRYCINMINIGFDCSVVDRVVKYKTIPFVSGSFAYILGVVDVLLSSYGEKMSIVTIDENGKTEEFKDEYLLCDISKGNYCGGGFKAAPLANLNDGLLDIMIIKKVKRTKFISLVGDYKRGTHLDSNTYHPTNKYEDIIYYKKCVSVKISGMKTLCSDGDVYNLTSADISIVRNAIRFQI